MAEAIQEALALGIEYIVFRRYFRVDLSISVSPPAPGEPVRLPVFALGVVAAVLAGFVASGPLHVEPFWAAVVGAPGSGCSRPPPAWCCAPWACERAGCCSLESWTGRGAAT